MRLLYVRCVLDGDDSGDGDFAGFVFGVLADAVEPDLSVAEHDAFVVDEEVGVFLIGDGFGDGRGKDLVVAGDELLWGSEGSGAGFDFYGDGVVDEGSYGG